MIRTASNDRKAGSKAQKPRFLIVSEGAVTEEQYLFAVRRSLRINSAKLEFFPPGPTSPIQIVERARNLRNQAKRNDPFDQVWCVFDVEAKVNQRCREGLVEALKKAHDWKISVALSNPCIELWLVLHVEDHQAWIDSHTCQHLCSRLKITEGKHLVDPDGLYAMYHLARTHAANLDAKHARDGIIAHADRNPSSGVYQLIDAIREAYGAAR